MKYLVTGGAGFIGSNYLLYMAEKHPDARLVNLDALTYAGNLDNLRQIENNSGYRFVKGDITDREQVFELFEQERFDIVVNFAAESHVDRAVAEPDVVVRTNILGTQVLLDAAREYGVERFHQVSTDEVYGDLPLEAADEFFTEKSSIKPSSPYSASKAGADLLVLSYFRTFKLPVTVSRCSNNYGPYQFPEKLIPLMISRALEDRELPVYGDGRNVRDWLHVFDHCRAIDLILENGRPGEVYNVGGHNELPNIELVKVILKLLGKPESLIQFVRDRPGHDLRYAINPEKLERELGWKPEYDFERGIKQTSEWYINNREWLRKVMARIQSA